MSIEICPRCQRRYTRSNHSGDYVHQCNSGDTTLDQEDVLVIGDWSDYTGSAEVAPQIISQADLGNDVQFERAGIEGADIPGEFSDRGKNIALYRQRQFLNYIPAPEIDN